LKCRKKKQLRYLLLIVVIFLFSHLDNYALASDQPIKPFFQLTLLNQAKLNSDDLTAMRYYQMALDQMAHQAFLDAGLSLMEIITFHPKSPYYGAALYRLANLYENRMANNVPSRLMMAHTIYKKISKLPSTVYNSEPRGRSRTKLIALKKSQRH